LILEPYESLLDDSARNNTLTFTLAGETHLARWDFTNHGLKDTSKDNLARRRSSDGERPL
jgi:glucose-6-phosphate 1-dehydrogenase